MRIRIVLSMWPSISFESASLECRKSFLCKPTTVRWPNEPGFLVIFAELLFLLNPAETFYVLLM